MQAISTNRTLEQIETEIKAHSQYVTASIIAIGNALIEAKAQLEHGDWENWLTRRVNFSQRTANNFMRIAREIGPASSLAGLPYTKVLALLDVPADQREKAADEMDANNRSAAALRKAISDRKKAEEAKAAADEARKRAEAERDAARKATLEAEEARDRAANLSEQYNEKLTEAQQALKTLQENPMPTVTATVAPDDYEEYKAKAAQADALKRRVAEAEQYAEQQEAAARRAQAEARRLEAERTAQEKEEDPYSGERLGEAVSAFMAAMGTLPHMGAFFFGLSADRLAAYRPNVATMRAWVEGMEAVIGQAEADKTGAIENGEG